MPVRPASLAVLALVVLVCAGCPWDDPCYTVACGGTCTLCDADDLPCQQGEPARVCDEGGVCVIALPGAPVCPPVAPVPR